VVIEKFINSKKPITILLIVLGFVITTYGCSTKSNILLVTPTIITAANTTVNEIKPPLIIETDETKHIYPVEPTPSPTIFLSTPTTSSNNKIELPSDFFILTNDLGYDLRIVDVSSGAEKELFSEQKLAKFVEWRENGCQLVVLSEGNLELINLDGERVETLFTFSELKEKNLDPYGFYFSLSPNENWVWYWQVNGKPYNEMGPESNYEVQNIFTISKDFSKGPYQLTKNGGGWLASWDPSGERIAYSDYDANGIVQVFVSSVHGNNKIQITDFKQVIPYETYGMDIRQINWSTEGNNIAITYASIESQESGLATVIIDPVNGQISYYQLNTRFLWWIDTASFMIRDMSLEGENTIYAQELGVGHPGFTLKEAEFPEIQNIHPFFGNQFVGFFCSF